MAEYGPITDDPAVRGGARLEPVHTATTVRVEGGETLLTDGPFADSGETVTRPGRRSRARRRFERRGR